MKKITMLFFSTSRYEYLFPVLESLETNLDTNGVEIYKIFIDDYPKDRDNVLLDYIEKKYSIDKMIRNVENIGYSKSWKLAWSLIPEDTDYIWHQEDDLELLDKLSLVHMMEMMESSEHGICQLVLKREVCYEGYDYVREVEKENGYGWDVTLKGTPVVMIRLNFWIAHPGLYPMWVTKLDYPHNPQENILIPTIRQKGDYVTAIYGARNDKNRIKHLGEFTRGQKFSPGEPEYETWGKYDKDKTYYSLLYLTEWKGSRNYALAKVYEKLITENMIDESKCNEMIVSYYKRSIESDSDNNKKYTSCIELFNRCEQNITYLLKAIKIDPTRVDAYHEAMMYTYHTLGNVDMAYNFGLCGYKKCTKTNVTLWNLFVFNFCMVCYYSNNRHFINDLYHTFDYSDPNTQEYIKNKHLENLRFYENQGGELVRVPFKAPSVVIIDNFLADPNKEREFALSQEYIVKGNYPGARTISFRTNDEKSMFERILNKKITYWPDNYNGSYQYVTKNDRSWIHRDRQSFSAMLYLTPNPPPNSGTKTYMHKKTNTTMRKDEVVSNLDSDSYNMDAWHVMDVIENRFNRLVLFQGTVSHMSADYFGDSKETGRLFKIWFFNAEDGLE